MITVRVLVEVRPVGSVATYLSGVGRDLGRVDHDVADEGAVEEVFEAEVFVCVDR
jgi:hypothetical protein